MGLYVHDCSDFSEYNLFGNTIFNCHLIGKDRKDFDVTKSRRFSTMSAIPIYVPHMFTFPFMSFFMNLGSEINIFCIHA